MKISRQNFSFDHIQLFNMALEVSKNAYAVYSLFKVGAALLLDDGSVITGVNVENRSYGLTNCAERSAICSAISLGKQAFKALAIATPNSEIPVPPCGACRQVISEFMDDDAVIIFGSNKENIKLVTVKELYPFDSLHELKKS